MFDRALVFAPAKLNLHLDVGQLRADGYHGILSLFQAVSLGDRVGIVRTAEPGIVIKGDFDCPPERNSAFLAARIFLDNSKISDGVVVSIEKRIPVQAGMGGGSSDAAAVLRGMDALFCTGHGIQVLKGFGASVGSDVPFFMEGAAAIVQGRGESIFPVPARTDWHAVVVWPGFGLSTKEAYAAVDASRSGNRAVVPFRFTADGMEAEYRKPTEEWKFGNTFQDVLEPLHGELGMVRCALKDRGASFAMMTGSGSAVFGVFGSKGDALAAHDALKARWPVSFTVDPLGACPQVELY